MRYALRDAALPPINQLAAVKLPSLALVDRTMSAAEVQALLEAFPTLRRLRLSRDALDDAAALAIASHANAASRRRLDLSG